MGKSLFLRYWGKRPIPGFWGFSSFAPLSSRFDHNIKYQQVALNMTYKSVFTSGVPISQYKGSYRAQKAVTSNTAQSEWASLTTCMKLIFLGHFCHVFRCSSHVPRSSPTKFKHQIALISGYYLLKLQPKRSTRDRDRSRGISLA